jgi:hypothetical protein
MCRDEPLVIAGAGDAVLQEPPLPSGQHEGSPSSLLSEATWGIANLEVPLTAQSRPQVWGMRSLRADPNVAQHLSGVGLSAVSLANNLSMDQGWAGVMDTMRACTGAGLTTVGAGQDAHAAWEPTAIPAARWSGGRSDLDLAVIALTCLGHPNLLASEVPGVAGLAAWTSIDLDPDRVLEQPGWPPRVRIWLDDPEIERVRLTVLRAREQTPLVVAVVHWGVTLQVALADLQRVLGHLLIDAGDRAVFRHHAHVSQACEWYAGAPILYGLGSLVLQYDGDIAAHVARDTTVALVDVHPRAGHAVSAWMVPGWLDERGWPCRVHGAWAEHLMADLQRRGAGLDGTRRIDPQSSELLLGPAEPGAEKLS